MFFLTTSNFGGAQPPFIEKWGGSNPPAPPRFSASAVDWEKFFGTEMNILYICLQYTVLDQSLGVTVESVPYDVMVYASITVKKNVVSVTVYVTIAMHMDMHNSVNNYIALYIDKCMWNCLLVNQGCCFPR